MDDCLLSDWMDYLALTGESERAAHVANGWTPVEYPRGPAEPGGPAKERREDLGVGRRPVCGLTEEEGQTLRDFVEATQAVIRR